MKNSNDSLTWNVFLLVVYAVLSIFVGSLVIALVANWMDAGALTRTIMTIGLVTFTTYKLTGFCKHIVELSKQQFEPTVSITTEDNTEEDSHLNYEPWTVHPERRELFVTPYGFVRRQVVCAANLYGDTMVIGVRHTCPLMRQNKKALGIEQRHPDKQGFVDQWGTFMDRKEALFVLKTNGRFIRDEDYLHELYSENLY